MQNSTRVNPQEVTKLKDELERMDSIVLGRLDSYESHKRGKLIDNIVGILLASSKNKGKGMGRNWIEKIYLAVEWAITNDQPINISLAWACGTISLSSYKFLEVTNNLPRLGDIWTLFWFKILNQKIQTLYSPGIKLVIIDEVPHGIIIGRTKQEIRMRQSAIAYIAREITPFIEIVSLPFFQYDGTVGNPCNDEILAILMSLPLPISPEVSELCYRTRVKPWKDIMEMVPGSSWKQAENLRIQMKKVDAQKKESNFTANLFDGNPFLEACIVDKGRWSPDIWNMAFPQHGGTVLDNAGGNRFSISCIPEARLLGNGHRPVFIDSFDFRDFSTEKVPDSPFVFYWTKK